MAGRVTDIEAVEANFATVLVGAASGGVWKSTNAGTTWEPIFDQYGTSTIGDVAIFQPNANIIWVGTGEDVRAQQREWGDGVYKSTDGGKTFANMGLSDTHHIGVIATHPTNPNIVYVAAQGHLWGHNGERGVFKTTDGGKTWQQLTSGLPDDDRTGASELKMDPTNPNILYATIWERIRQPHLFESGGPNGGIYKSTNGGETWTKLTNGLPDGPTGKIGITIHRKNPSHPRRDRRAVSRRRTRPIRRSHQARLRHLSIGGRRHDVDVQSTVQQPAVLLQPHLQLDPNDPRPLYVLARAAQVSEDGGATFSRQLPGIEGDFHAIWIDPNNSDRFYIGNDKGASVTYDRGQPLHHVRQHGHRPVLRRHGRQPRSVLASTAACRTAATGAGRATAATTTASSATTGSSSTPATASTPPSIRTTGASSTRRRRTAASAGSTPSSVSRASRSRRAGDHQQPRETAPRPRSAGRRRRAGCRRRSATTGARR